MFAACTIASIHCPAQTVANAATPAATAPIELATLPIEQLLALEVYSASKFVQKISDAPSAVSIVTAADIKAFGWRTIADILRSMRGIHISNDRNYTYLGARGYLRPGDYNTRFLLLIDGNRINDSVFDQASIGSEALIDVDLIERVEFVSGPGSSVYGSNAFFGVINIITKRGHDLGGAQASVEAGSYGARKVRASYGFQDENGAEFLLSASSYRDHGPDLYFPEFDAPATHHGVAQGRDYDRWQSLFVKGAIGAFSLSIMHSERKKGIPTASFSQVFNDPRSHTADTQSAVDLAHKAVLSPQSEVLTRLYWGRYDYQGDYIYGSPSSIVNRDMTFGRWWGGEARLVSTAYAGHKLVLGAEYQRDYQRDQINFDADPYVRYLDERRNGHRIGVYAHDELTLRKDLLLNAGLRYDRNSSTGGTFSPRVALIYRAAPATTLKAIYGTAFRAPNAYEMFYQTASTGGQKVNPDLQVERIRAEELIAEQRLGADMRVTVSVFRHTVSDLISQSIGPVDGLIVFENLGKATARGAELELEKIWNGGMTLRAGYSRQQTKDFATGEVLVNSPRHLAKFNFSAPIMSAWRAALEAQYVGPRNTLRGKLGGYWLANATLAAIRIAPGLDVSASVYNLSDRRYADPGSAEHVQDALRQNGRTWRLKLAYAF